MVKELGRNDLCICGSGKKYKICCLNKEFQTFQYNNEFERIKNDFISHSIPIDTPGFYSHPKFIAIESRNPEYLVEYAKFVRDQPYTEEYFEVARKEIPRIFAFLHAELVKDGAKGKCLQMTWLLGKMLEMHGFWNYGIRGAFKIDHSSYTPTYFRPIGFNEQWLGGHTWIVAPPFTILDLTVNQQLYENRESEYLPDYVITESLNTADVKVEDIFRKEFNRGNPLANIAKVRPDISQFIEHFHTRIIDHNETSLKYTALQIIPQFEYEFAESTFYLNGRSIKEIYRTVEQSK
ncbi:SEC-C domain-containing protein [Paenibacillus sp. MMO-58]|uniref:SEC-C domain-containing protein n=1 Tax=Paenibacillus sp. MMO-58 TaxID=3081290 RepID=UPI00301B5DEE